MYKGEYKMHIKSANIYLKVLFVIALCVIGLFNSKLFAQTEPMYSQYMYNMLGVNPAYAGNREALSLNFFQRNQWVGIKGAPKTTSISMDQSIKDGKLGWGIQVYDDRLGVEAASGLNGMLSTRIQVSEKGIGLILPIFSIVFLVLANKAIKKDEDLVKSVDRLR